MLRDITTICRASERAAGLALLACLLTGCATVTRGRSQNVLVLSEPAGAAITIDGVEHGTTPMLVALPRRNHHMVQLAASGHANATVQLRRAADYGWLASNALLFHPAVAASATGVDLLTGAYYRLEPSLIDVHLTVSDTAAARAAAATQRWQPVPLRARIRVGASESAAHYTGTVLSITQDTLVLSTGATSSTRRIARNQIASLEIQTQRRTSAGVFKGIALGAVAGCAVAYTVVSNAVDSYDAYNGFMACTIFGVPAGGLTGAAIGALAAPSRWLTVHPRTNR